MRTFRLRRLLVVATALAVLATATPSATAQSSQDVQDARQKVLEVRRRRAAQAAQLDATRADDAQVKAALDALGDNVRGQEASYANASRKADDADTELVQAKQAETDQEQKLTALGAAIRQAAIKAYVQPPDDLESVLPSSNSLSDAVLKKAFAEIQSRAATEVLDAYDAASQDLTTARKRAQRAADKATKRRADAEARLGDLKGALAQQRKVLSATEDRLDELINEAAGLAQLDATVSADYSRKESALVAQLAAARALSSRAGLRGGIGGTYDGTAGSDLPTVPIVEINGIKVNEAIGNQVAQLVSDARQAGFEISGGGYRSAAGQIATRRANCGASTYAIWRMPPSACRPPAARPGKSMHEQGLAIDITCNGLLITSRGNTCYRWLANNGWRYGLKNLPSEPWHWSTNGY